MPSLADLRSRLPLPAVVAATVLALLAAIGVFTVLDDTSAGGTGDGAPLSVTDRTGTDDADRSNAFDLTPIGEVDADDAVDVAFTWPDGSSGTLSGIVDGPTVVNFFASWCPPCVAEMPDFEDVSAEFVGDVTFFGIAVQDRPEDARRIVETTGITYRWARDVRGDIAGAAGVIQMPTTMFLDGTGAVVSLHSGAIDADRLRDLIAEHLGVSR